MHNLRKSYIVSNFFIKEAREELHAIELGIGKLFQTVMNDFQTNVAIIWFYNKLSSKFHRVTLL